ncbi:hypothetical protein FH972_019910 [Carpinus fangiana]|uniref:Uncharacterized protein n=1 Tax=Carpinus fangiana TaxID=176857 RepID=A0A5N6RV29_9ROSI|nr:hypothetical protein FH972_019910 [Carpinus fangiana]
MRSYTFVSPHNPSLKSIGKDIRRNREITATIMMVAVTRVKVVTTIVEVINKTTTGGENNLERNT